ncbi:MAG TPA: ABC transporter substrate-binding protein [Bacillota bacterium]|nr:ABC transporter substrate-binding protein [Bacillota bacterium]
MGITRRALLARVPLILTAGGLLAACGGAAAGSGGAATGTATAASAAASASAGSGQASGGGSKSLTIALNAYPPKMDPAQSTAYVDRQVYQSIYDSLVTFDKGLAMKPGLADSWDISQDGLTYTFHLHQGIKFHDGTPFNADAVVFNTKRYQDPASPRRTEIALVESVTATDASTVVYKLQSPFAPLLSILGDRAGMMVSPDAVSKQGGNVNQHPVGTGPFTFKEMVQGDHVAVVKNPAYWQPGLPKLDSVLYKAITDSNVAIAQLKAGQVGVMDTVPPNNVSDLSSDTQLVVDSVPGLGYAGFYVNLRTQPFSSQPLRQAVSAAIDRAAYVKVMFGTAASPIVGPFPPSSWAYDSSIAVPPANPAAAKQFLAQGGQSGGFTFTMTIPGGSPLSSQAAQVLQNMLGKVGITMKIEEQEFGALLGNLNKGNFTAALVGWSGRVDPDQNSYSFLATGGGNNNGGYSSPQMDQLLKQARVTSDQAQRKQIYSQIVKLIEVDVPYVYLDAGADIKGLQKSVQGYVHIPDGLFRVAAMDVSA